MADSLPGAAPAPSPMTAQVLDGEIWAQFCDTLKRAGQQVLRPEAPATPLDRAEGWRYLTRLLRIGLGMHLEYADAQFPAFFSTSDETAKIGADNPDNLYLMARIDGRYRYRVSGTRGSVYYLSFGTQKGGYESNGRMEQTGFIEGKDLQLAPDGSFELTLSPEPVPGNWIRIEEGSNALLVRQTFMDRRSEKPAQLTIRRLDAGAQPAPLDAVRLHQGLTRASAFVEGTATLFANWAQGYLAHANQLPPADQALCQRVGGDPKIHYYHSYWRLAPDEALVIEVPRVPQCRFWNLQINNWWMESLDYRYHRIHVNPHTAKLEADGSLRMVIAHEDPGHPNWLETAGHDSGTMCLRWIEAAEHIDPTTRVVKLADLKKELNP